MHGHEALEEAGPPCSNGWTLRCFTAAVNLLANENWSAWDFRPHGARRVGTSTDVLAVAP
jgi:hypothetical protein